MPRRPPASHLDCLVCGCNNSFGLDFTGNDNTVSARFQATPAFQGYAGVLHGGVISTLLDAAMTHCLFQHGIEAMTADLQVRFLKPASCQELFVVSARLVDQRRRFYQLESELLCGNVTVARAKGRFLKHASS